MNDLIINVLSNVISAFILTLVGVLSLSAIFLLERQKLLRFFGVDRRVSKVSIFVSRLQIKPGGTSGFEPINKGYHGPGIIRIEYKGALLIRDLLYLRFIARLPSSIKTFLAETYLAFTEVETSIDVSPDKIDEIPDHNLILLGSGIYNLATSVMLKHSSSEYEFFRKEGGDLSIRHRHQRIEIGGREFGRELGIIERINDTQKPRTVFICAGVSSSATFGCARYLAENWRELRKYYDGNEFSMCLAFQGQEPDEEKVTDAIVLIRSETHSRHRFRLVSRKDSLRDFHQHHR